jgi:hypothetical protein
MVEGCVRGKLVAFQKAKTEREEGAKIPIYLSRAGYKISYPTLNQALPPNSTTS